MREGAAPKYALSEGMFAKLKELRLKIAHEEKVPAFVVFSDATLVDMCQKHPQTEEELLSVSGVGQVKRKRYGDRFLQLFRQEKRPAGPREKVPELTAELFRRQVVIEAEPVQITRVADHFNAVLLQYGKPKTSGMRLNELLVGAGYLMTVDGVKLPTKGGREVGIATIRRHSSRGDYVQCLFGPDAQRACAELILKEL